MADKFISKIPDGPLAEKWTKRKSEIRLVSPNNKRKLEIIVVGTGLGGASAAAHSVNSVIMLRFSASVILLAARTLLRLRVVSMQPRTIRTTMTLSIVSSTTPSKVVTTEAEKPMSIVSLKSAQLSLTSA